ncbi:MAG: M17 family peptidase N-terminal domain-containing protein, partial [Patescibacteria group bacterium]
MKISAQGHDPAKIVSDLLIVPLFGGAKKPAAAAVDAALGGILSDVIAEDELEGKDGEAATLRTFGKLSSGKVALLGCGSKPFNAVAARRWGARAAAAARAARARKVVLLVPDVADPFITARALAEGLLLGDYRFLKYKDEDAKKHGDNAIQEVVLSVPTRKVSAFEKGIAAGERLSRATILARGLVNEPALEMTPGKLVEVAKAIAAAHPGRLSLKVFDKEALEKMGCGGILA